MIDIFYLVVRLIFFALSLGVAFHLYHLMRDAAEDLFAVYFVKEFEPNLYKEEYEILATDRQRNMRYRFAGAILMLSVAIFVLLIPQPRPMSLTIVMNILLICIPLLLLINARDEHGSKKELLQYFRRRKEKNSNGK